MRWQWKQSTGGLWRDGRLIAAGYSGAPGHRNRSESEALANLGPIPRGLWRMTDVLPRHPRLGTLVIRLNPDGHTALGRSDFYVHGDNAKSPGTASRGCIILGYAIRLQLAACAGKGGDQELLEVV